MEEIYVAKKAIGRAMNGQLLSPFFVLFGLIRLIISLSKTNNEKGFFQTIGYNIDNVIYIILGISIFIYSYRKVKKLKKEKFNITDDTFYYIFDNQTTIYSASNKLKSISYLNEKIQIEELSGEIINIDLLKYTNITSELGEIKNKIEVLKEKIT